ncbi:acyl-CoA dehydrogenase family protein [Maricurvus nonylphenolicus]|uniref:acyl-CoA dehydrogenase family protein n=1 Tax=Maricurvus nonylphenolicus TaxID=1008307 RepID=UPI0036F40D4F
MDLNYSPEYQEFRQELRDFLEANKDKWPTRTQIVPTEEMKAWQKLLIEHGYTARTYPKEYGCYGAKPDVLKSRIIAEEFTAAGAYLGLSGQGVAMLVPTLLELGTEEQKAEWVEKTLHGDVLWCQGYSEPGAGSDLASLSTKATEDGDDFIINGQKIWTSTAAEAHMMFCLVRTEPDAPKHKGISYLLIPMDTPGIEVRPLVTMTGEAEFNEVFFTDVRVPKTNIVGARGEGWAVANSTLKHERGMLGDPNIARNRLEKIIAMMKEETIDGTTLMENPLLRDRLLQLQARMLTMQFNSYRTLTAQSKKQNPGLAQLVGKLQGCELRHQISALAIDVLGELGLLFGETPRLRNHGVWQRQYMFDLGLIIGGGTAQIQKNIIAERGLGMPREPKVMKTQPAK